MQTALHACEQVNPQTDAYAFWTGRRPCSRIQNTNGRDGFTAVPLTLKRTGRFLIDEWLLNDHD